VIPNLSVVIVNYNAWPLAAAALGTLAAHLGGLPWEAVVIDNSAAEAMPRLAAELDGRLRVVRNARNVGFAKAANQGVAATRGRYVLLLNPDSLPLPGLVQSLVAELDASPECGAIGPEVRNPDGTPQGSARGDPNMFTALFGRSTLLTRVFPRLPSVRRNIRVASDLAAGATSMEVDWVSGACVLLRRTAFERVGGFDERYFLYWEDADLGRRLRHAGFTVRYMPSAGVSHQIGESSRTTPALAIREFHRSAYLYYTTHVAVSRFNPARPVARLLLGLRCRHYLKKVPRPVD
jgi:N-acetylglucosaminyl-diphospho-decaprenol L-rhamnosyltransferase